MTTKSITASSRLTLALCSLAALSEGFDNQSMGVAAPKLVPQFALSTGQASLIFSAATLGLFLGAAVGGRIADRAGRRNMLAVSLFLFGVCSLLTSAAVGPNSLFLARLLTGFGLGGALPNFIALASEATRASERVSSVTVIMAGMPFGGFLAGLVALGEPLAGNGGRRVRGAHPVRRDEGLRHAGHGKLRALRVSEARRGGRTEDRSGDRGVDR